MRPNPQWDKKRPETAFLAFDIAVIPVEHFGEQVGENLRNQLKDFHDEQRRVGLESGFMVVLCDVSTGLINVCGVGFERDILGDLDDRREWREALMYALNTGKIV